jgi:hypothetical protein
MRRVLFLVGCLTTLWTPSPAVAQSETPIQLALLSPVQLAPESDAVRGVRLSLLYGKNTSMTGRGLQWSVVNNATNFRGLQVAIVNYAQTLNGVQVGLINIIKEGGMFPIFPIVNWSKSVGQDN